MKSRFRNTLMKIYILCLCIALLGVTVKGVSLIININKTSKQIQKNQSNRVDQNSNKLADEMDSYPNKLSINQPVSKLKLYKENGDTIRLSEFQGKNVILMFWTSWCKYCNKELRESGEYKKLLKKYPDVEFILLNKLDSQKETKKQALQYLNENQIPFPNYFDQDLTIYNELGIKIVPTILFIDKNGILRLCNPGNIDGKSKLEALIEYVKYGGEYATEQFVSKQLTGNDGGVHVNFKKSSEASPSGYDVLSESQGIMMEYAILKKDHEMFRHYLKYIQDNMLIHNKLTGWVVLDKKCADTNSFIDDLRIYKDLIDANKLWGGYENLIKSWESNLLQYNISHGNPVDFYNFASRKKADTFKLCFGDLEAIKLLGKSNSESATLYDNTLKLMTDGYISDDFPLYYSSYHYKNKSYLTDDLNMAEAMYTLLYLARDGKLKSNTLDWLNKTIDNGGIFARYTIKGDVAAGYGYESTAVYAILAMVAKEVNDEGLMTKALARMEQMRINDKSTKLNGAFGNKDGTNIYSFDQCMALLAYTYTK